MGLAKSVLLAVALSSRCFASSLDDDTYIRQLATQTYGPEEAAFRATIKALPGESVAQLQARLEYEVKVWRWFRELDKAHTADAAAIDKLNAAVKGGTLTEEEAAKKALVYQRREAARQKAIAEFRKEQAAAIKANAEAADRAAILSELQEQTKTLTQIRDTLDIQTGTTRY